MLYEFHYTKFASLKNYIDRIGAEQINFRRFMVKEYHGRYYIEKTLIKLNNDCEIECRDDNFLPTEEEAKAIKAELSRVEFPVSIEASAPDVEDLIKSGQITGNLYTFWDNARTSVLMCQERRDLPGDKIYIPWTLFGHKGRKEWLGLEPDGALRFWKLTKKRQRGSLMIHEGAKTAAFIDDLLHNPEKREERQAHPWTSELEDFEHWGAIGGALATHRCDFSELHREKLEGQLVYVCDHDMPGEEAAKVFSRHYRGIMLAVKFDNAFPVGWDLADPLPKTLYSKVGTVNRTLLGMAQPATWATDRYKSDGGRPGYALTKNFLQEWCHTVSPELYCHTRLTQYCFVKKDH